MGERMTQVLGNLRSAVGSDKWDAFFEAMYDAFGKHDELDGENAVLFEQVQNLKRENNELKMKYVAANRKSIDLEHEVAYLKAEYEGLIEPPKDEDGETWHIGDKAYSRNFPTFSPHTVCGFGIISDKPVLFYLSETGYGHSGGWDYADSVYHSPDTWERILNESYMRGVKAQQEAQMEAHEHGTDAFVSSVEIPDDYDLVARCHALCERTKGEA